MKALSIEMNDYKALFLNELHNNILAFWMRCGMEKEGDGFYGAADLEGNPVPGAPKSCVLNARILWTFSEAARRFNNPAYAEVAHRAAYVMNTYFRDQAYGGYFMSTNAANQPLDTIKHTYAQAFALYAWSKYCEFNPSPELLQETSRYFDFIEHRTKAQGRPGYQEAFTREWSLYDENRMADHNEPRSMNTHLHVLEAYAAWYKVSREDKVAERLKELLLLFTEKIIRPSGHLGIFFDEDFHETEQSKEVCSFGHDIEASWLLLEAAEILNDAEILARMRSLSLKMLDAVDRVGVDKDGGLFLESTRYGSHLRTNKHWWPQAETLVAFMNAFELTSDAQYWEKLKLSWDFIDRCMIDHTHGEWFTKVNRLGVPFLTEPPGDPSPFYRNDWKIDPWKCPYHNGRAMMELAGRIEKYMRANP